MGIAALNIARHPQGTYLGARYKWIVVRRGKIKAIVPTEHSIPTAVWHMLVGGERYHDPGSDIFTQKGPARTRNNAVRRLHERGDDVTFSTREAARPTLFSLIEFGRSGTRWQDGCWSIMA